MPVAGFAAAVSTVLLLGAARSPAARAGRVRGLAAAPPAPATTLSSPGSVAALLVDLGVTEQAQAARAIAGACGVSLLALAALVGGPAAACLASGAVPAAPALARGLLKRRLDDRRDAQLPQVLDRLASSLRAGTALGQALVTVASATPDPLGTDLRSIGSLVEHGAGVPAALSSWGLRVSASAELRHVTASLSLAAEAGGQVARSVDRVAATLRERRELRAEARALSTQARASAAVLALAPLGFAVLLAAVEPAALTFLVASPIGLACLTSGLLLEVLGAVWMARMLRSVA